MIPLEIIKKDQQIQVPPGVVFNGVMTPVKLFLSVDVGVENRSTFSLFIKNHEGHLYIVKMSRDELIKSFEEAGMRLI